MKKILKYTLMASLCLLGSSCGNFLEPQSQNEYEPKLVQSIEELLLGESYIGPGDGSLTPILGLFDDDVAMRPDLTNYDPSEEAKLEQVRYAFTWAGKMSQHLHGYNIYSVVYNKIVGCNAVLDYVDKVQGTEEQKNDVKAQALTLRAYFYFYLVNLYGKPYSVDKTALGVPLKLSSELKSGGMARHSVEEVYNQVVADLTEAERLLKTLPANKKLRRNNRVSLPFTQLLLSRVYLYMERWDEALHYAEQVMQPAYGFSLLDLNTVEAAVPTNQVTYPDYFTSDNPEVLFLFDELRGRTHFPLTRIIVQNGKNSSSKVVCTASQSLIDAYDDSDLRKNRYLIWENISPGTEPLYKLPVSKCEVGSFYNLSIVAGTRWGMAFRLSEAYLNGAEAAAMRFKATGKADDAARCKRLLNELRKNRFAPADFTEVNANSADGWVQLARAERRRELCFENHRWFDLRRYGMPEIRHTWYEKGGRATEYVLKENDPGYTLMIPHQVFGLNPELKQNEERNE